MRHPLSFLADGIWNVTKTALNAIESVQAAPIKAIHAHFGSDPDLTEGDHIGVYHGYMHHGLYVGEGMVIHYTKGIVQMDTLETFKNGRSIEKRLSSLNCSRKDAVRKAYSRLGEAKYNLLINNCEHFVEWCRS